MKLSTKELQRLESILKNLANVESIKQKVRFELVRRGK